jgi:hypothetical protein
VIPSATLQLGSDNSAIGPFTPREAGSILESTLMLLHRENALAH